MKYHEDTEMWTDYKIHAFCINTQKIGDKYQIYETYDYDIEVYDNDEDAQTAFQTFVKNGFEDYEGVELQQYWYEEEDGDVEDEETIEKEMCTNAPQESKDLYKYGINEDTGKPLVPKKKKIIKKPEFECETCEKKFKGESYGLSYGCVSVELCKDCYETEKAEIEEEECARCGEVFSREEDCWGSCHGYYECGDCWENHKDRCSRRDCGFREDGDESD